MTGVQTCALPIYAAILNAVAGSQRSCRRHAPLRQAIQGIRASSIATMDAKVGQPEVLLGMIPGAGGTQRLPRLVGPELALKMCTDGKSIAAPHAAAAGLIDHIIAGDIRSSALGYARAKAVQRTVRKTREVTLAPEQIDSGLRAAATLKTDLLKSARGLRAPVAAVESIEAGLQVPFDQGSARERELFAACVVSVESRSLRHLFFAERDAAREKVRGLQVRAEQAEGDARQANGKLGHVEGEAVRWKAQVTVKNDQLLRSEAAVDALRSVILDLFERLRNDD